MTTEVMHGECAEVLPEYPGRVDLILTSPPCDDVRGHVGHEFNFVPVADACITALSFGGVPIRIVNDRTLKGARSGLRIQLVQGFMNWGLSWRDPAAFVQRSPRAIDDTYKADALESCHIFMKGAGNLSFKPIKGRPNRCKGTKRYRDTSCRM